MAKQKRTGVIAEFDLIQIEMRKDARSDKIAERFLSLGEETLQYIEQLEHEPLITEIPGKSYFSFFDGITHSRPVNSYLYTDSELIRKFIKAVVARDIAVSLSSYEITQACYTLAMSLACTVDLGNIGDRQTPGTYFQYLITHLISRELNCSPSDRVKVKVGNDLVPLTMDLILDLGEGNQKYHIAVKNSSRERASEVWSHQRILFEAFPTEKYIGIYFGLTESKLNRRTGVVTEICVPNQWRAYQQYISHIASVYYLDPPAAYLNLNSKEPPIAVKPFGDFFSDGWLRKNS
jgi:hypothetical protein